MPIKRIKNQKDAKTLKINKKTIILFYMNGCFHCESLKPNWIEAVNMCPDKSFIEIESKYVKFLPKTYKEFQYIAGFPTIIAANPENIKINEFNQPRDIKNLVKFFKTYG